MNASFAHAHKILLSVAAGTGLMATTGMAQEPEIDWWVPQGAVHAMALDEATNTLYMGGDFTLAKPPVPIHFGVVCDTVMGIPVQLNGRPDGDVLVAHPTGDGGWYIGGNFLSIDGVPRQRVARLNADGTLHPWAPTVDVPNIYGRVTCIERIGSRVFLGGLFNAVNGEEAIGLAVVDATTGATVPWTPADALGMPFILFPTMPSGPNFPA